MPVRYEFLLPNFYSMTSALALAAPLTLAEQPDAHAVGPENGDLGLGADDALARRLFGLSRV